MELNIYNVSVFLFFIMSVVTAFELDYKSLSKRVTEKTGVEDTAFPLSFALVVVGMVYILIGLTPYLNTMIVCYELYKQFRKAHNI